MFQFMDSNGLNLYRQNNVNIHTNKTDVYAIYEFENMRTEEQLPINEKYYYQFEKRPFVHHKLNTNLCDSIDNFPTNNDILIMNINIYEYKNREYSEYRNVISHLYILNSLPKLLKKKGHFIFSYREINLKLTHDLLKILSYLFKSVKVIKTKYHNKFYPYKTIFARKYRMPDIDLSVLTRSIEELNSNCSFDITEKKLQSVLNTTVDNDINKIRIHDLNLSIEFMKTIFDKMKDINKIPLYQQEAKLKAINLYEMMKIPVPIIYLFDKEQLSELFYQPKELKIVLSNDKCNDNMSIKEVTKQSHKFENTLFMAKRQIDDLGDIKHYSYITDLFKISNTSIKPIAQKITKYRISQAFLKMCEILYNVELIDKNDINVFHVCEAPGQFILAFTRYCEKRNINYNWKATTLRNGLGDTYGLIKNNQDKWKFGKDDTGDITVIDNILNFAEEKFDILTSDCGLPTVDFGFQEEELLKINFCQLTTILLCLKENGNCCFKTFLPIVYPLNLSIFQIFYESFEKVIYYKPTLNPSSSEIYVIGIKYKQINEKTKELLLNSIRNFNPKLWLHDSLNCSFIKAHFDAIDKCINNTIKSIYRSIISYYYYNPIKHSELLKKSQRKDTQEWINKYLN
uniref:Ribosomal RNA methyltransferase FtsJ domain-containing protein n=1 Tax=viral metagenome TaxID=1070528 RepID=A0A6C0EBA8_9ZZZZ